jgi:predicted DNA-binding transcriptional regulator YafY
LLAAGRLNLSVFLKMLNTETSRLSRLTSILLLLQSKRLVTANSIAQKFDISIRTAYRDIKALEEAGVPILVEDGKGYSLMEGYMLPPVMFSESEANALITAEQLIAQNKDASFVKEYTEALAKIKADKETTSNYLSAIQLAITNLKLTEIIYSAENKQITKRIIEPLALYSTQENWVLIAYCRLRKEKRAFRLDRIEKLNLLNENFEPSDFTLQQYFEECKAKCFSIPLT